MNVGMHLTLVLATAPLPIRMLNPKTGRLWRNGATALPKRIEQGNRKRPPSVKPTALLRTMQHGGPERLVRPSRKVHVSVLKLSGGAWRQHKRRPPANVSRQSVDD